MSKSLQLINGDLSLSNRQLDEVSGRAKLIQDLTLHLKEKIGTDPTTPSYGSILDGGIINNTNAQPFIGRTLTNFTKLGIQKEISRILTRYQSDQAQKIKSENITFSGKNTLEPEEIIKTINQIDISNIGATVIVRISLTTLTNTTISLALPLVTA